MRGFFRSYRYCPACGHAYGKSSFHEQDDVFVCAKCGFQFWQNSKPAVALIIPNAADPRQVLITRRAISPHKGKLDVVGGFVGLHEDPLAAAAREAREEIGRAVKIGRLFHIDRERYVFRGTAYSVLVMYFLAAPMAAAPKELDESELSACFFIKAADAARVRDMAFGSDRRAMKRYVKEVLKKEERRAGQAGPSEPL